MSQPRIYHYVGAIFDYPPTELRAPHRAASLAVALATTAALAVLSGCSSAAVAADEDRHGATAMSQQQHALEALQAPVNDLDSPDSTDDQVWAAAVPDDNEMTPERVALGRALYFDTRLSADGTVACATCHDVTRSFTDRRPVSEGIRGQLGRRNAPTTMNAALLGSMFLDGRVDTLEQQAVLPITNPIEMGHKSPADAVAAIAADSDYQRMFKAAYGRSVNFDDIGRALAAFERTLIFLSSPFDRYLRGDQSALSQAAKAGWALYNGKARCVTCHPINLASPIGSDDRFHNIGIAALNRDFDQLAAKALKTLERDDSIEALERLALSTDSSELGRFMVTKNRSDIGAFRTPQVTNVGITAPYMHDGSMQTLWDVMDHYNKGGEANLYLDGGIEPLALTENEINQVVAFLFSLTDDRFRDLNRRELERQYQHAQDTRPFRDEALAFRRAFSFGPTKTP